MSLRDDNLRLALTKAIADVISSRVGELRDEHFRVLVDTYEETGTKQFSVKLPDGTKVATITLTEQKETYEITDQVAFLQWMRAHQPDAIETVVIPPQPEMTFEEVKASAQAALLKRLEHAGDMPFDPKTGEVVDGITYRPTGRPKSFQVRYENAGREQVIDAWRTGALAELVGTDVLPQIGDTPS